MTDNHTHAVSLRIYKSDGGFGGWRAGDRAEFGRIIRGEPICWGDRNGKFSSNYWGKSRIKWSTASTTAARLTVVASNA
ncbi:MAG: hypothetical protein V5A33_07465, partial [Halobacteriales archaeon]